MSVVLTDQQIDLIDRIARENGFSEYETATVPGSQKGDNFLGILTTVTIKSKENDEILELIMKSAHQNEAFRKAAPIREAYIREIYLYESIFVEYKKFEEDHNILDRFESYAKIFGSSLIEKQEFFVMENLRPSGYQLWNRKVPMNCDHISAVLKEYAKFHAISFAFKQINPELFARITGCIENHVFENAVELNDDKIGEYVKNTLKNGYKVVEGDPILTEFLVKYEKVLQDLMMKEIQKPEYKEVVLHGDCWCNNVMFKYEDTNETTTPTRLKIVDWQLSHISSPAQDFCYFFLANSSKEILENYKTYMKLYYNTLSKQLRNFGCDPDEVFPYSRFEKHIKIFMVIQLHVCFMILKVMLCDSEEAPDLVKLSENNSGFLGGLNFRLKNFDLFSQRIMDLIQFVNDNEFIS